MCGKMAGRKREVCSHKEFKRLKFECLGFFFEERSEFR